MGDFRIVVEGVGNHGCGREAKSGEVIQRCGELNCVDCLAAEFVKKLHENGAAYMVKNEQGGASTVSATIEHWPKHDVDGKRRRDNSGVGPIDDLLDGTRRGSFGVSGKHGCLSEEE